MDNMDYISIGFLLGVGFSIICLTVSLYIKGRLDKREDKKAHERQNYIDICNRLDWLENLCNKSKE